MNDNIKLLRNCILNDAKYTYLASYMQKEDITYTFFQMSKESFIDTFDTRLEISIKMGINIYGLEEVVKNVKLIKEDEVVLCHSITSKSIDIAIYTDISISIIVGLINFNSTTSPTSIHSLK